MAGCYRARGAGMVNTIDVGSIDVALQQANRWTGKTVLPTIAIPCAGNLAYCQDTEGDTFGMMMQADSSARQGARKQL